MTRHCVILNSNVRASGRLSGSKNKKALSLQGFTITYQSLGFLKTCYSVAGIYEIVYFVR